jgi:hypothetical protein
LGGKKYTNSHISNQRREGGKECGSGKGEGCRSGSGSGGGKKKGKEGKLFMGIVKKKHISAFTLLTKTTKHIFHTKLTIVQRKSTFWGESQEKYTNPQFPYQ